MLYFPFAVETFVSYALLVLLSLAGVLLSFSCASAASQASSTRIPKTSYSATGCRGTEVSWLLYFSAVFFVPSTAGNRSFETGRKTAAVGSYELGTCVSVLEDALQEALSKVLMKEMKVAYGDLWEEVNTLSLLIELIDDCSSRVCEYSNETMAPTEVVLWSVSHLL